MTSDPTSSQAPAWHMLDADAVVARLGSDPARGLPEAEAGARLSRHGPNAIRAAARRCRLRMLAAQFGDFTILSLIAAAIASGVIGARFNMAFKGTLMQCGRVVFGRRTAIAALAVGALIFVGDLSGAKVPAPEKPESVPFSRRTVPGTHGPARSRVAQGGHYFPVHAPPGGSIA